MSTPIGAVPDDQNHEDEVVHAYINGTLCELFQMRLEANGCCVFESTGTTEPSQEALQAAPLRLGANKIRLVYRYVTDWYMSLEMHHYPECNQNF